MTAWLLAPAPPQRLAMFRIVAGAFATIYLAVRLPAFLALADSSPARFDPVGVLSWLDAPVADGLLYVVTALTLVSGVLFGVGVWFRISGPAFALGMLALTTYRSSWGQVLYFENLLVLHLLIIGFARAADAWTVPRSPAPPSPPSATYGWPLRLAALVMVTTYVLAGVAKLRIGGAGWMNGDSLRNHIAYSATRLGVLGGSPSPLARPLMEQSWIFTPLAIATLVLELGAPIALLRRARVVWVAGAWLLHAAIAATMFVVFPYPLALIAFAPLFDLESLGQRVRRWRDKLWSH